MILLCFKHEKGSTSLCICLFLCSQFGQFGPRFSRKKARIQAPSTASSCAGKASPCGQAILKWQVYFSYHPGVFCSVLFDKTLSFLPIDIDPEVMKSCFNGSKPLKDFL